MVTYKDGETTRKSKEVSIREVMKGDKEERVMGKGNE